MAVLDALEIESVHAVGFHTGATIAIEMAARNPDRIRSAVLAGVLAIQSDEEREYWRDFGALSQRSMPTNYPVRSPFLNALDDMIHCIETGAEPRSSGRDGMRAFEMIAAIHLSHRAGKRPIEFPLVERDFEIPSN